MAPPTSDETICPAGYRNLLFHVIVDNVHFTFTIDGPDGLNGVRLHLEMLQASRTQSNKFRDFDLRLDTHEAVLSEMQKYFPGYRFVGTWTQSRTMIGQ